MITLIWKELRENFKWALLAMIVLGAAEVYGLYPRNQQEEYYGSFQGGLTLLKVSFLTATSFGCAAIGLMLGLVQIIPELRRDRWASLLHRPVSRGVIFRGKVVAGLILYLLATVTPFLYCVWLAATPGHFAVPFLPAMVRPGVSDICVGAVFYFAALSATLQRGGWMIVRVLPLLAAIHAWYFAGGHRYFYVAVEGSVLMGLGLFTAAWGEILNPDSFTARPWLAKVAFLGVAIYSASGLQDYCQTFFGALGQPPFGNFMRYQFTDTGVPVRVLYGKGGVAISVTDLDGKPVADRNFQPGRLQSHIMYLNTFSNYVGDSHGWRAYNWPTKYRQMQEYLWAGNPVMGAGMQMWFNLSKQRYLIAYSLKTRMPISILDQGGFEPPTAVPQPFPSDLKLEDFSGGYCLWDATTIRYASLVDHKITDISLPGPPPICGVGEAYGRNERMNVEIMGVVLNSGIAIYDSTMNLITVLPYHYDPSRWGQISVGVNGTLDRYYLYYQPSSFIGGKPKEAMPSYLDNVDPQGKVLASYTMWALPHDPPVPPTWVNWVTLRTQTPAAWFGTMLYQKIGATVFASKRLGGMISGQFSAGRIAQTEEISLYILGMSLVLAVVAFLWARRGCFSRKRAWLWTAFVFAFSLPGFIAFRLVADWPRLVNCPACNRRRPAELAHCPHCGAAWPAARETGTEIFDQPRPEAPAVASA